MSDTPSTPPPDDTSSTPPPVGPQQPGGSPPPWYTPAGPPGGYAPAPGVGYGLPPTGGVGQPADLLPRFLARLVDFILVGVVNFVISLVTVVGALGLGSAGYGGMGMGGSYATGAVTGLLEAAVSLAYFVLLESRTGQTVGKMLLRLRTEGPDGRPPSLEVAVRRNFWVALGALSVIPVVGGLIGGVAQLVISILIMVTISQSPTRQGWHDTFAGGTRVVRVG
jgi:uncharacterized RDD family membrane protein YckC